MGEGETRGDYHSYAISETRIEPFGNIAGEQLVLAVVVGSYFEPVKY